MAEPDTRHMWGKRLTLASVLLLSALACTLASRRDVDVHEWWAGDGPVVPHDNFPADCSLCHDGNGWNQLREDFSFDHEAETGVALSGSHQSAGCLRCHNDRGPVQVFAARGCAGCHENVHRGQLGANCEDCHSQADWRPNDVIARHARTGFPLIGSHAATACWRCHPGAEAGDFARTDSECLTCHSDDLARATNPNHISNGWVESCDRCHIPTTWLGAGFNHATFPLTGRHRQADCSDCHTSVFAGTPDQCIDCHLSEFQSSTNPNHGAAGISTNCDSCHTTATWLGATVAHTTWPLTGSHIQASCQECHTGSVYAGTPNQCADCHLGEYQTSTSPNHAASGFPTSCENCHTTTTWFGANFSHTTWPLTGSHVQANCTECHINGVYAGTPNQCVDCHLPEYQSSTNPDHAASGFPTSCENCHTTTTWLGASFSHTTWPLTGSHTQANCTDCHINGVYAGLPNQCVDCHFAEYQSSTNPDHAASGFPTSCENCHTTTTWLGANFPHTTWPLTGSHIQANCTDCHINGVYAGLPNQCDDCHLTEYQTTTNPNHTAAGFPTTCDACHNTTMWLGAVFNHSFPITSGKHNNFDCSDCHLNPGNFMQFSCIDCHEHNQADMADEHKNITGYLWSSPACLSCHPDGKE